MGKLKLTEEWDKTFPESDKVDHSKVTFVNRFDITLAADLYMPKIAVADKFPAIVVNGPFGAVKEQSSGPYTQTFAERGFLTIAFNPSFTGENSGQPHSMASPNIDTEDFSAAVGYPATHPGVDAERVGMLGICGWRGFAINAAANDTHIKTTVTSTMYDISRTNVNDYFGTADNADARYRIRRELNAQRTKDYRTGTYPCTAMSPEPAEDVSQSIKDYYDYHRTKRGYHSHSVNSGLGWNRTSALALVNAPILVCSGEVRSTVLLIHGEKAHSRCFSEDAFKELKDDNKELMIIPGTVHADLYGHMDIVSFDKIGFFFRKHLR